MKNLLSIIFLFAAIQLGHAQINHQVTAASECFPTTVTIIITSTHPQATTYSMNINSSGQTFHDLNVPYVFVANTPDFVMSYAVFTAQGSLLGGSLPLNISLPSNVISSLNSTLPEPFSIPVGATFPVELITNDTSISSIEWDFGNGSTQTGGNTANPVYTQPGNYTVTCTTTSSECGTSVLTTEIHVSSFTVDLPTNICVGAEFPITINGAPQNTAYFSIYSDYYYDEFYTNTGSYEFGEAGPAFLGIQCHDVNGDVIDYLVLPITVLGEGYQINPYWSMIKLGDTIDLELLTWENEAPEGATNITWSVGGTGPSVSHVYDNAGYFNVTAEFTNTCNNQTQSEEAFVLVADVQVNVTAQACAPANFTITHSGEEFYGIMGMELTNNSIYEWFNQVNEFEYYFEQPGDYVVTVYYALGDAQGSIDFPIYIPGPSVSNATVTSCGSYQFGPNSLTTSGSYEHVFVSSAGCDSTVLLNLTIVDDFEVEVSYNQGILSASQGDSFQWFNCSTGEMISGATNATYIPQELGLYGVIATLGDCTDTSSVCFNVTQLNLEQIAPIAVQIYPNPANDVVYIQHAESGSEIILMNQLGQKVLTSIAQNELTSLDISQIPSGAYFIHITGIDGVINVKSLIVK